MKRISTIGLVNGLLWQVIGIFVGMGFVTLVRFLMHLPAWKAEPAVVFGMLFGALFFLYGVGVLDDWLKWASGKGIREGIRRHSFRLAALLWRFAGPQGDRRPVPGPFSYIDDRRGLIRPDLSHRTRRSSIADLDPQ